MNPQDPWNTPAQTPPATPSGGALPPLDPSQYPQAQPAPTQAPAPVAYPQPQQTPAQAPPQYVQPAPVPSYQDPKRANDYSIDYLNSIAPNQQKVVNKFAVFGLIGGVIIAAIFGVMLLSAPKGTSPTERIPPIAARIASLKSVTSAQQKHLNENQISETNAALNSALGTMDTEIKQVIKDQKIKKSSKKTTTIEEAYAADLTKTLDDAYQRGTLDRTYTSQMTYELTILEGRIASLKKSSKNKAVQEFCVSALSSIDLVLKSYESFDASKQ